jgi:hypothetical protein
MIDMRFRPNWEEFWHRGGWRKLKVWLAIVVIIVGMPILYFFVAIVAFGLFIVDIIKFIGRKIFGWTHTDDGFPGG